MEKQTVDFSQYNNDWYKKEIGAGKLKQLVWYFVNTIFFANGLFPISSLKVMLLRIFGAKIGARVVIKPGVNIKYPWMLTVGDNTWIGEDVWIDNLTIVRIGKNVCLSQGSMLLTGNHNYRKTTFDLMIGSITLDDGVWIGAKSMVCPGIICESHAVLAAGSVATRNLAAYTVYQGNPALPVKSREIGI